MKATTGEMKWEDSLGKMVKLKSGNIWFYGILSYSAKEYVLDNGDAQLCFLTDDDIDEIVELKEAR